MSSTNRISQCRKIGFVGKGGAGKSTCIVLLAHAMRQRGCDVCVLDTDSTNEGLHLALGITAPPRPLIEYFGGMVFQGGTVTCPADDPTPLTNAEVDLAQLPASFVTESPSGVVLLTAGKLTDFGLGAGCDGPLVKIARDLTVRRGDKPLTLLVDLKAGIEDTSRGVIVGMDDLVVVCDPSTAGLGFARAIKQMTDDLHRGAAPATRHMAKPELAELARQLFRQSRLGGFAVILNKVPDASTADYMRNALAASGIKPIALLPCAPDIQNAWLRGTPLPTVAVSSALNEALDRLASRPAEVAGR